MLGKAPRRVHTLMLYVEHAHLVRIVVDDVVNGEWGVGNGDLSTRDRQTGRLLNGIVLTTHLRKEGEHVPIGAYLLLVDFVAEVHGGAEGGRVHHYDAGGPLAPFCWLKKRCA